MSMSHARRITSSQGRIPVSRWILTIAATGGNVEDLSTSLESAPMSGHPIFHARGVVALAADGDASGLIAAIENLGPDLSVSIER